MAVTVTLVVAACGKDTSHVENVARGNRGPGLVAQLRQMPFSDSTLGVVTAVLRESGIGVYDDSAAAGLEPVRVTQWQARNLAVEAANGGGVSGAVLDKLTPSPTGAPPIAFLLAAWASGYNSPGALFVKALLGEPDWHRADSIVFPKLALTLFVADAISSSATSTAATIASTGGSATAPVQLVAFAGPCTTASSFIQNGISAVAIALKVSTSSGGFLSFLGKIWNTAVDIATGVVNGLIDLVTLPVVNLLVNVFGVIAAIAQVTSFLTQWRVGSTATPEENRFGVTPAVVTGTVRMQVDPPELPIPDVVIDCAAAAGVDMRDAGSAAGSTVTWDGRNMGREDLSSVLQADDELDANRSATYTYQTGQESSELAQSPNEHGGLLELIAHVERNDIEKVRLLFAKLLLDQIPEAVRAIVEPIAGPILGTATRQLAAISDVSTAAYVAIRFHSEPNPTATSPRRGSGLGGNGKRATIPMTCPLSTVVGYGWGDLSGNTILGEVSCFYVRTGRSTQLNIQIAPKAPERRPEDEPISIPGTDAAWIEHDCDQGLDFCYEVVVVVGQRGLGVGGGDARKDELVDITRRVLGVA